MLAGASALALGVGSRPAPPDPAPVPVPGPSPDDLGACEESTWRYGCDLDEADDFLLGLGQGEGGLPEKTADLDGFVGGEIGLPLAMASSSAGLELDMVVSESAACRVHVDARHAVAAVTDLQDEVLAYVIGNEAVETHEEVRMGTSLDDVLLAYPDAEVIDNGGVTAVVTAPVERFDYQGRSSERRMLFLLDGGEVSSWSTGQSAYLMASGCEG